MTFNGLRYFGRIIIPLLTAAFVVNGCGGGSSGSGDAAPPQNVSLTINNGEAYASSKTVSLSMGATDDKAVSAYYISESQDGPVPDAEGWVDVAPSQVYSGTVSYELGGDYGDKKLYVWFKDAASNVSEAASATITLAFVAPTVASPNVIMIVIDTLRADHLPVYGYVRDTAPNISALAASSVVFGNAYSAAPWTLPSYASMLLGKQAYNHDYNVAVNLAVSTERMLPDLLQDNGYRTVSVQTNAFVPYLDAGFDERADYTDNNISYNDGAAINHAMDWINNWRNEKKSFFLFIGLISPHWPYKAGNGYLSNFVMDPMYASSPQTLITLGSDGVITYDALPADLQTLLGTPSNGRYYMDSRLYVAAYDSEIRYADEQVGRLIATLKNRGLYDNSIIIVTSDHGENMVEHDTYFTHGNNLYNSLLKVPLLIKFPGQTTSRNVTADVRTIDILPTVLDYAGIGAGDIDGKSLLPVINNGEVDFDERPVISYWVNLALEGARSASVVKDGYKLIKHSTVYELYNLTTDASERFSIASTDSVRVDDLDEYLLQFYAY